LFSAVSTMVEACASVTADMMAPGLFAQKVYCWPRFAQ
jgi:hypothetical protein